MPNLTLTDLIKSDWFKTRPKSVQEKIVKFPPGLYRLTPTGQKVTLISYGENKDGSCTTVTVAVEFEHNPDCTFERSVFGIPFEDLEPIDTL